MPLTTDQTDQYHADGFVAVPDFFTIAEVALMQQELQRLCDLGLGSNVATDGDGKTASTTQVNLQIIPLAPKSEVFRALPFAPKVRETVAQLIGDAFLLQLDQIFYKPARHGVGTSWHQDNDYFRLPDPRAGVGMWVALHEATVANGTMHVVPGSFTAAREHTRDPGSNHHVTCRVDEAAETVVPVELPAGGVLFFNYGVAHCTTANKTDRARAGLALHFVNEAFKDVVQARSPNRPVLAGPHYVAGREVYGCSLEGQWAALVEGAPFVA